MVGPEETEPCRETDGEQESSAQPACRSRVSRRAAAPRAAGPALGGAAGAAEQPLQPVEVSAVLRLCIAQLSAVAWQKMGLQADPFTNAIHKDIAQAKTAIDSAAALVEKLLPQLGGQEAKDYQSLLTDLRMNFLRQAGTASEA